MMLGLILNFFLISQLSDIFPDEISISQSKFFAAASKVDQSYQFLNSLPPLKDRENPIVFPPIRKDFLSLGVDITAKSAILVDRETKAVLFTKNSQDRVPIASITKLLTSLVFIDLNPELLGEATLYNKEYIPLGRKMILVGETYSLEDLFNIVLVGSDNNAANLLSKHAGISQEDFIKKMNEKAIEIGMKDSYFVDATGLDARNVSTAYDVSLLIIEAYQNQMIQNASILKDYAFFPTGRKIKRFATNTDKLLNSYLNKQPYSLEIGKTGFINEAGYCFSALIKNFDKKGDIIAVVLGASSHDSRFQDLKSLVTWGFDNYEWKL